MDNDREFLESFLEDYFAECDEHLLSIKKGLLLLEELVDKGEIDREVLERLLRNFHTIKGLSAMVGVSQAEELSHSMENILKGLKSGDLALSREILDILNRGVKRLEETIIAKKEGKNLPDISGVVERLKSINAVIGKATKVKKEIDESIDRRVEAGFDVWLVKFTPSQELSEKGINVEIIKGKLEEIGEIIRINPKIGSDKKVSFEFYVATKGASEDNFSYLREFDLEYQLYRAGASSPISEQPVERRTTFIAPSNFVRVDVSKLDNLMRILGELVVTKSRLESELRNLQDIVPSQFQRELEETNRLLERYLRELRESFMSIRLVPIGEVFDRMRFVINDLIKESNKKINLEISGQETEIDKFIVEKLVDPILHLVRNAVSHGIESEEERIKKGKPPVGRLSLR
ncbi:MAG: Hpt domain-containing protein, partial [bacterium]|nr:Hpt domain-containing protein [bacterium]